MTDTALHPFDRAVALQPVAGQPNLYEATPARTTGTWSAPSVA